MAEHLRLAALAGALFVLSYGGVAWALAGAPIPSFSIGWLASWQEGRMASLPASLDRTLSLPAPPSARHEDDAAPANENPNDDRLVRDKLRLAAYQTSMDYALAPCDKAAKARLIAAISAYARAWQDMMDCNARGCDSAKLNAADAAFSTALDMRVREAIGAAFDKRGISVDDFPAALRINVTMLARGRGDPVPACPQTAERPR